jgi:hypothetical protein
MTNTPSRGDDGRASRPASPLGVCARCGTPRYQVEVDSRDGGAHTVLRCACGDAEVEVSNARPAAPDTNGRTAQ